MDKNSFTSNKKLNNEEEIFKIIKGADSINKYFAENLKKLDSNYLISSKDIKLFQFIFKYFLNSLKYKDINIFFRLQNQKIICKKESNNNDKLNNFSDEQKYIVPKFINFCLFHHIEISKIFHKSNEFFLNNVLKLTKILFLNDFIKENDFNMIIFLQIILCLYKKDIKCINIQNTKQLYIIIDFLLSFCSNNR